MSLRKCPDCGNFHRGRAVVCRRCARERLALYACERLNILSRETFDPSPVSENRVPDLQTENAD